MKKIFFIIVVLSLPIIVLAEPKEIQNSAQTLSNLQDQFIKNLEQWINIVQKYALRLFLLLASVNFVVRMVMNLIEGSDIQKIFVYLIKFFFITGIFYFFLEGGIGYAQGIVNSFLQIAYQGISVSSGGIGVEDILSLGWSIVSTALSNLSFTSLPASIASLILGCATFFVLLLIVANYMVEILAVWFLVYLGYFLLAFGGSEWTREVAIGYIKAVISSGMRLMVIIFMAGLAVKQIDGITGSVDAGKFDTMVYCFTVAVILLMLITKVPDAISSIVSGAWGHMSAINMSTVVSTVGVSVGVGKTLKKGYDYLNKVDQPINQALSASPLSDLPASKSGGGQSGGNKSGGKLFNKSSENMSEKNTNKKEGKE